MGGKHVAKKSFSWRVVVLTWHLLLWTFALNKTDGGRGGRRGRHSVTQPQPQPSNGLGGRYSRWRNEISPPPPPIRATPQYEFIARSNNPLGLSTHFASGSPHSMPVGVGRMRFLSRRI